MHVKKKKIENSILIYVPVGADGKQQQQQQEQEQIRLEK